MNAILGSRIRDLRVLKGFTQEQVAEEMNCTRQKYARIEKGLTDISYACLNTIAQIFDIHVDEITSSVNRICCEQPLYRANSDQKPDERFDFISTMIDTFYAHRKLYCSVRQAEDDK